MAEIVLTGIKPTGEVHLGNYLGAIRPAIDTTSQSADTSLLFIADYHSLTSMHKGEDLRHSIYNVAATWIACGLDTSKSILYKQSDIPEIFELQWILSCFTPKGFMNRAHAYKAKLDANQADGKKDLDHGVNMGLYNYPVLMSADILMFNSTKVPVGEDQIQHLEFARDIAQKFNNNYGDTFTLPEPITKKDSLIPGLDGRKMSKSYNNGIPLFLDSKKLRKKVMKIKTDSSPPESPKDPDDSLIFDLYKYFSTDEEQNQLAETYRAGIAWGEAKQILFEKIENYFTEKKEVYDDLMADTGRLDQILDDGAQRAREIARPLLNEIRKKTGVSL
tara:strand:+ start:110724 stop:111722 length:999 start_codon:yes stop_codon:yes gene_type:complete